MAGAGEDLSRYPGDIRFYPAIRVDEVLPEMPGAEVPADVPGNVGEAYLDGLANLEQRRFTPAAGCFRTAIDRATKLLWRDRKGDDRWPGNLATRLKELQVTLDLPASLGDWGHTVRVIGNDIHDLEAVTETDASDAAHFCEMFLTYAFSLPTRVQSFRARREGPG